MDSCDHASRYWGIMQLCCLNHASRQLTERITLFLPVRIVKRMRGTVSVLKGSLAKAGMRQIALFKELGAGGVHLFLGKII